MKTIIHYANEHINFQKIKLKNMLIEMIIFSTIGVFLACLVYILELKKISSVTRKHIKQLKYYEHEFRVLQVKIDLYEKQINELKDEICHLNKSNLERINNIYLN